MKLQQWKKVLQQLVMLRQLNKRHSFLVVLSPQTGKLLQMLQTIMYMFGKQQETLLNLLQMVILKMESGVQHSILMKHYLIMAVRTLQIGNQVLADQMLILRLKLEKLMYSLSGIAIILNQEMVLKTLQSITTRLKINQVQELISKTVHQDSSHQLQNTNGRAQV